MTNLASTTMFDLIDRAMTYPFDSKQFNTQYPPYNHYIKLEDDSSYNVIEIAVTGFDREDISVTVNDDSRTLVVEAKTNTESLEYDYVVRNLAQRSFRRIWSLKPGCEVQSATLENGILRITIGVNPDLKDSVRRVDIKV